MKKWLFLLTLCFTLFPSVIEAKTYSINDVPNIRKIDKRQYLSDPEHILSQETAAHINISLYHLEEQTGIETAVVILPSIGNEEVFDFAYSLGKQWGVGKKKKDNGLVILLVIDQHRIQFATGYGLEGVLPDATCKKIQLENMIPSFKNGDWNQGMANGIDAVCARLSGSMQNDQSNNNNVDVIYSFLIFLGIFAFFCLSIYLKNKKANCCPNCGKAQLQRTGSQILNTVNGVKTEMVTYTCRHCGHQITRQQKSYDENYRGHGFGGPIIGGGGFFGGGDGGDSFGGGDFGGGDFGGGGSGTGF